MRVYNSEFDPVILPGETATIVASNETVKIRCLAVGALPEYIKDFGDLTAVTWSRDNEDSNLEFDNTTLAQFRMRILDNFKMEFSNLGPTKQWRTDKVNFFLQQFPQGDGENFLKTYLWKASEFFVWRNDTPRFDLYSTNALKESRVSFGGWRFKVERLPNSAPTRITIYASGWPSGR